MAVFESAESAVSRIYSGAGIYIHSNAAAPKVLIEAMTARKSELKNVRIYQLITLGEAPYTDASCSGAFYVHTMFVGPNTRQAVNEGRADYTPVFFSDLPNLFKSGHLSVDICLLTLSPPDNDGYMTLGTSVDSTWAALKNAKIIIAEVNKKMPRSCGQTKIHMDEVTVLVETDRELPNLHNDEPGETALAIGKNIASLVEDNSTIQVGIGAIPNAVLKSLTNKRELGVHTEMFSDAVVDLVKSGVITNNKKTLLPGKIAVSFAMGSKKLYDFIDQNENIEFRSSDWINNPHIISQNHKMTAINAALQIDLTGQVCADSLGTYMYSGCGGQVDFVRGASHADGGKAIIALESTAKNDTISRIVPCLAEGAGVVTSRADIYYVVTEHGIANLHGKNMKDRVNELIKIASPKFQAQLERDAYNFAWFGKKYF